MDNQYQPGSEWFYPYENQMKTARIVKTAWSPSSGRMVMVTISDPFRTPASLILSGRQIDDLRRADSVSDLVPVPDL